MPEASILLTFYQFVASYQGSATGISYLGKNITEYFVKKKVSIFNLVVSKKLFGTAFILEILYNPFVVIYGDLFSVKTLSVMNFIWYGFAFFYFTIFLILFFQCTKCILKIKLSLNVKLNGNIIRDINKMFLKKTVKERTSQNEIELLRRDILYLSKAIKYDDNPELQEDYNDLINNIFNVYSKRKQYEIFQIEKKDRVLKNQVSWIYNANNEVHLLQEIIDEKYFALDEKNMKYIFYFHMDLLKLNLKRAKLAGCEKVSCNRYETLSLKVKNRIFDVSEWVNVTQKIYRRLSDEKKQDLICFLQGNINQEWNQDSYKYYCRECAISLIKDEIDRVFAGERQQRDFVKIFGQIIKEENINDLYSEIIINRLIGYNRFDAEEIISLLSKRNCTYVFTYVMIYYSIYKFRFEWDYINVKVLKMLWERHGNMQDNAQNVIMRIHNSNIEHRFEDEMYTKFMQYIHESADGELWDRVKNDKMLDAFYVWVIKTCVINKGNIMYGLYKDDFDLDTKIVIINELSKHDELLENKNILNWIRYIRRNSFGKQDCFLEKLNITLRSLLLTNVNVMTVVDYACENHYLYIDAIGAYLLIKLLELPVKAQKQKRIKTIVKMAYISSNMPVEEYINMIEKECILCKCEINYAQKEKMKEYLIKTF